MFALPLTRQRIAGFVLLLGFTSLLAFTFVKPGQVNAIGVSPSLGAAASFAVLGGQSVTNTGPSVIGGDLGVSPGTSITNFPPGILTPPGVFHQTDAVAAQAQVDLTTAYNNLAGQACDATSPGDLGNQTLLPGVYCSTSTAGLTGPLTLDAQGDPNAVFIFDIESALTTASSSVVSVINGGSVCNVWWRVGSDATLGTNSTFVGNLIALSSITATTSTSVTGRLLARNASVTLDTNNVNAAPCISRGLSITKNADVAEVLPGGTINYSITYRNTGNVVLYGVSVSDVLPANTTFNGAGSTAGFSCSGSACSYDLTGPLAVGDEDTIVFSVFVNSGVAPGTIISNTASISDDTGTAINSDDSTTPVTTPPDDDDDDDDDNPTSPPPAATAPPPAATAGPGVVVTIPGVVGTVVPIGVNPQGTPIFSINGTPVVVVNGTPIVLINGTPVAPFVQSAVLGLPNTGGAAPQATYWLMTTPRP